jgi:hypothetical protein
MHRPHQPSTALNQEQQPQSRFDALGLLACVAISVFLIVWITLASRSFNLRAALFLLALPWVVLGAGGIITAAVRFPSFFALDFLLGVAAVSVVILAWKVFVPLSLWIALTMLLIAVVGMPKLLPRHRRQPLSALGLLAVIVSLVAASGWSQDLVSPTSAVKDGVVFKPWSDFFFHATVIARGLGPETLLQVGNYEWKGFPAIFYHYASYSIAWCLAKAAALAAYPTAVGFWAPFGSFLTGLASYALARAVWNQSAGLAALVATFLIPDAWLLNVAHPSYGYFWLQHISPAGLYGVAIAGTALILIALGAREACRTWITCGVAMAVLTVFFKAQIFAAAFPLLLGFAIVAWPLRNRWNWLILGSCMAAGIALLPLADRFYVGANMRLDFCDTDWFWKTLANLARGTRVERWYEVFRAGHAFPSHLAQAIGLLLVNALGGFAIVAPAVWLVAVWRKRWQAAEGISLAAIAILLLMTFGLGRSGTAENAYEFMQRPFVWTYWLVGALTAGHLFSMLAEKRSRLLTRLVVIAAIGLTLVPACYGAGLQRGKWTRGNVHADLRVDRGLIACARYIRSQPPANAVTQDSRLDRFLVVAALGERPAFAARLDIWLIASKAFRASSYEEQLQKLKNLQEATNIAKLRRIVRETGIRWYMVHPGDSVSWPAACRDRPAFESNGYKVYDLERCLDLTG